MGREKGKKKKENEKGKGRRGGRRALNTQQPGMKGTEGPATPSRPELEAARRAETGWTVRRAPARCWREMRSNALAAGAEDTHRSAWQSGGAGRRRSKRGPMADGHGGQSHLRERG